MSTKLFEIITIAFIIYIKYYQTKEILDKYTISVKRKRT